MTFFLVFGFSFLDLDPHKFAEVLYFNMPFLCFASQIYASGPVDYSVLGYIILGLSGFSRIDKIRRVSCI